MFDVRAVLLESFRSVDSADASGEQARGSVRSRTCPQTVASQRGAYAGFQQRRQLSRAGDAPEDQRADCVSPNTAWSVALVSSSAG